MTNLQIRLTTNSLPVLFSAVVIVLLQCAAALGEETFKSLDGFDDYMHTALADWKTPGIAVAIVKEDKILLAKGYGAREHGKPERVDENTLFPVASVSKVFNAVGLALLVQEGKIKWDDRVVEHLPEFQLYDPYLTKEVQLKDLLAHRTGLERADILSYRGDYDRPELIRRLRYLKPVAPFRDRFGYHNLMVVTAGEILERTSGKPWEKFIAERVFAPLKMKASHTQHNPPVENKATTHVLKDGKTIVDPLKEKVASGEGFRRLHRAVLPAGGVQSTAADLANFLLMVVNEGEFEGRPFLSKEIVRDMAAPRSVLPIKTKDNKSFHVRYFFGCGIGWQMRDYRGRKIVYHTGSSGAVVAYMPEEKIGVAVVANRGCGIPFMVMHDVFDRLLGIPRDVTNEDWLKVGMTDPDQAMEKRNAELEAVREKGTAPSLRLKEYVGTYESDLYGKLEISLKGEALHLQFGANMNATLRHWEHDTFRGQLNFPPPGDWLLEFVVEDSKVRRVEIERIHWHESMPPFVRGR